MPSMYTSMQETEDWHYVMEPSQTCCLSLTDGRCPCPRGKTLGGSSATNAMVYIRGNRKDFDSWSRAGNPGWDYDSMLKHFSKFENIQEENSDQNNTTGGELEISHYVHDHPIRTILQGAYRELGYTEYEESKPLGYMDSLMTISQGTRSSTGKAFISKIKDRKNLYVAVNAQVGKLLTNKLGKVVNGVEVKINNKVLKIKAKKEVVLSAGSINSPKILMNSGIGPRQHLESLGIDVLEDLKVGENLQDHLLFPVFISINKEVLHPKTRLDVVDEIYQYFMHRQGLLGELQLINFVGFINTKNNSIYPNIEITKTAHYRNDPYMMEAVYYLLRLPEEVGKAILEHNSITNTLNLYVQLLNPKSRGKILLRNADPFEKPLIFPNYLSDAGNDDIRIVVEAAKTIEKLIHTKTFEQYDPEIIDYNLSNCKEFIILTEDYWKCAVRNVASNVFDPVGTCKMGPKSDRAAVVDPQLKVHGVKGIRVIDGSIMPNVTSCNTNAPIIAIGEKGATLIKEDWMF